MNDFVLDEAGTATLDWVALCAGVVVIGVTTVNLITDEVQLVIDAAERELEAAIEVSLPGDGSSTSTSTPEETPDGTSTEEESSEDEETASTEGAEETTEETSETTESDSSEGPREACNAGGTCYIDDDGDGISDRRRDGNGSIHEDRGVDLATVR
ncbi:MAG: hypothetical protein AAF675_14295 [Pseudomonadota bacterium]